MVWAVLLLMCLMVIGHEGRHLVCMGGMATGAVPGPDLIQWVMGRYLVAMEGAVAPPYEQCSCMGPMWAHQELTWRSCLRQPRTEQSGSDSTGVVAGAVEGAWVLLRITLLAVTACRIRIKCRWQGGRPALRAVRAPRQPGSSTLCMEGMAAG